MDDFTFPTAAAAGPAEHTLCLHGHRLVAFPDHFASSAAPLWFSAAAVSRAADMEGQEPSTLDARRLRAGGGGRDGEEPARGGGSGVGGEGEDKMDLLWEKFNEELEALRRAGSCSKAAAAACGGLELSDTESEPSAAGRGRGCAPMLMASSRAAGTGHYRRASSWVLLMRIFRRLFVVEKTISAARRRAP